MDVSFANFLQQMASSPALLITVLLTLGVIFVNGWTDAPNAIATCITTRCMNVRSAIWMSAIFNFLGVFVMTQINSSVASTTVSYTHLDVYKRQMYSILTPRPLCSRIICPYARKCGENWKNTCVRGG